MKNCTPLWREARFEVKMYKTPQRRTTFGSCDVEKLHAVVARSTFRSQNVQNTSASDHFWKLRCRKSASLLWRRSTFSTSQLPKVGPKTPQVFSDLLLEVEMSKKCFAVVARQRAFRSQNVKKHQGFGPLLEVRMLKKCMPVWREGHFEVKMFKALGFRTTFGGSDVASLHYTTLHYTTLHSTTLHYRTLHYTTLQYTTLRYTTLQYTPLH